MDHNVVLAAGMGGGGDVGERNVDHATGDDGGRRGWWVAEIFITPRQPRSRSTSQEPAVAHLYNHKQYYITSASGQQTKE